MGVKLTKIDELDDYRDKINRIGTLQVERLMMPWFVFDWPYNVFGKGSIENKLANQAHEFTASVISKKRETFRFNQQQQQQQRNAGDEANGDEFGFGKKKRLAMLDTLLSAEANHKTIDEAGIQEEVDTFVFEGFDTTMTAITFTLFAIANHEEVQQRLYEEIASLEGEYNYNNLVYLDAVIKESLRLYPPVPFIGRYLGEDTFIGIITFNLRFFHFICKSSTKKHYMYNLNCICSFVDNVKLPANTIIHIIIYILHRDPKYFPDPERFDPNRFLQNNDIKHPFAYVPFSAGQRNCIGNFFKFFLLLFFF